ncbi:hypothetical protein NDU88_008624 [Pleurodeles waltl]|uniref:Uncharacterized protein n=1 Tax=Pleurodeles waltl TaxID=8319 RepID=A0AAV7NA98_PLEWA|nr:hypothetical protein NDU88_008624 [Pleurodeles waltl]
MHLCPRALGAHQKPHVTAWLGRRGCQAAEGCQGPRAGEGCPGRCVGAIHAPWSPEEAVGTCFELSIRSPHPPGVLRPGVPAAPSTDLQYRGSAPGRGSAPRGAHGPSAKMEQELRRGGGRAGRS